MPGACPGERSSDVQVSIEQRREVYARLEAVLNRQEVDYTIHAAPGVRDFTVEEYHLSNVTPPVRLLPLIVDADSRELVTLARIIDAGARAFTSFEGEEGSYRVILGGHGWTSDLVMELMSLVTAGGVALLTLDEFETLGV
jgi:hypothetical protein